MNLWTLLAISLANFILAISRRRVVKSLVWTCDTGETYRDGNIVANFTFEFQGEHPSS